jgi:molybdate transport system ATP-binding protein
MAKIFISLCKRKWRKHLGYKKNIGFFSTAMTDLFQKNDSLEQMVLSGFFDSWPVHTTLSLTKNIVSQWLELVHLNHLKSTPLNTFSWTAKTGLIIRAVQTPHY